MTRDLCDHGCYFLMKREILVFQEEAAYSTEVNFSEEIVQVHIEYVPARHVHSRIGHDRVSTLKSVCNPMSLAVLGVTTRCINFFNAVLQYISKAMLNEL